MVYFWGGLEWVFPVIPSTEVLGSRAEPWCPPQPGPCPLPCHGSLEAPVEVGSTSYLLPSAVFCPELHPHSQAAPSCMETHADSKGCHWAPSMDFWSRWECGKPFQGGDFDP